MICSVLMANASTTHSAEKRCTSATIAWGSTHNATAPSNAMLTTMRRSHGLLRASFL
ncbi:hypothetical protein GCM10009022_19390 [Vreelandella titanicae]